METKQILAERIANAFPKLEPGSRGFLPERMTASDACRLRDHIHVVAQSHMRQCLGAILYDFCTREPYGGQEEESIENFVSFLDASFTIPDQASEFIRALRIDTKELEEVKRVSKERGSIFDTLSLTQRQVVYDWLVDAEDWPLFRTHLSTIRAARDYWKSKTTGNVS